ncbi:hypothetical protein AALA90_12490 [Lachnospiraceae bacterium 38-10]
MSRGREKNYPGYQVGTSFLLVIFVVMCLVLLGVLSLSGALRDKGYGDRMAEKTSLYYTAVSEAQHKLGEIDGAIDGIERQGKAYEQFLDEALEAVVGTDGGITVIQSGDATVLAYETAISESQNLCVELEILDPEKGEGNYKIVKWQEASVSVWKEEEPLPVLLFE